MVENTVRPFVSAYLPDNKNTCRKKLTRCVYHMFIIVIHEDQYLNSTRGHVNVVDFHEFHGCEAGWKVYLSKMAKSTEFGDHQMLQAAALYLGRSIQIVTSSPEGGADTYLDVISSLPKVAPGPLILLGHHYEYHYE